MSGMYVCNDESSDENNRKGVCKFGKPRASRKNICNASATPPGIKRGWYVCKNNK
jgi:hypothetical protein